ncbi:tetratricopeptide repeat-containing sulfotransferase family protein [Luteimonas terrae]|uniref:Tetratricopeptide (TPR) repeat protein n=1 Tax=Luteimonas terrae TaxID=1530191 RepID=A0ABU1Y331_9GAMM|nr:sulfotransferase [Luteimonas terrae]MDR7194736.1 tetratricopeptide (TPR) repeat protein [Luteimonas terrae]
MAQADTGDFEMLRRRADIELRQQRWAAAAATCHRLLALRPTFADGWFNLGYALRHSGAYVPALQAYAQALRYGVADEATVHVNRAVILADHLRDDAAAEAALDLALTVDPRHPGALLNRGNLHEERGHRDAAIARYRQVLAHHDDQTGAAGEALARLTHLVPPSHVDDPLLARLWAAARSGTSRPDGLRATLWLSLGRALDTLDATDAAFESFASGKQAAHRGHGQYDPAVADRQAEAMIAAYPTPAPPRPGVHAPEPLFICGMFRSGSTLLEQVLGAHPDVAAVGELDLLPRLAAQALAPFPARAASLDPARCGALAAQYHAALCARLPDGGAGCRLATDKRPDNYRLIGLIKQLFPAARIVHTVRDPRDVALSIFMQHLNPRAFPYAATLAGIGHQIGVHQRLVAHWRSLYPDDIVSFDYDAFVVNPEATLRPLLAHLGLAWSPACLQFHTRATTVKTASYWQVRRPLYTDASGRWRRYRAHLAPLEAALRAAGVDLHG